MKCSYTKNHKVHYVRFIVWRFLFEKNDVKCLTEAFENMTVRWKMVWEQICHHFTSKWRHWFYSESIWTWEIHLVNDVRCWAVDRGMDHFSFLFSTRVFSGQIPRVFRYFNSCCQVVEQNCLLYCGENMVVCLF